MKRPCHFESPSQPALANVCADVSVILDGQDGWFAALLATDEKTGRSCTGVGTKAPMMQPGDEIRANGQMVDSANAATPRSTTLKD